MRLKINADKLVNTNNAGTFKLFCPVRKPRLAGGPHKRPESYGAEMKKINPHW